MNPLWNKIRTAQRLATGANPADGSQGRSPHPSVLGAGHPQARRIEFRKYQEPVFWNHESGLVVLHWARQIGKSYTLAAWAVDRLMKQLERHDTWLVTVLSNSRDNGAEFVLKCQQVCSRLGLTAFGQDESPDLKYENMRMEVRVVARVGGRERSGRIKVLAANPRTARGFSGDLILDEFAFHEDSNAIWEAAEPILSANPEYLCRIASTGNGKYNMFYRLAACRSDAPADGTLTESLGGFLVSRMSRSAAHALGVPIFSLKDRTPITPEQARAAALDKRAYDQNYELKFADENMALLTHELIQQAERPGLPIDEQAWSAASRARMEAAEGDLYWGADIGRQRDLTVVAVVEQVGQLRRIIALLRLAQMRLPAQQAQLDVVCALPRFRRGCLDLTGIGLGLCEYTQEKWGADRVVGIHFAGTEPINDKIRAEGRRAETARVTELMATELLGGFEDRTLEIHVQLDPAARDDLRKPEKITSPGGRVSIAATRDEAGHADHFWSLALALRAAQSASAPFAFQVLPDAPEAAPPHRNVIL